MESIHGELRHVIRRRWRDIGVFLCIVFAFGIFGRAADGPETQVCEFSDATFQADSALNFFKPPTRFFLMPTRYQEMVQASRGYRCTGVASVAFNGQKYFQAGDADDPGLSELVPAISRATGTSLAQSYDFAEFGIIALSVLVGLPGFLRLFPHPRARLAGCGVYLLLLVALVVTSDVYVFQVGPLIAGLPWLVHFAGTRQDLKLLLSVMLFAFCCSWCSLFRGGASLIGFAFLVPFSLGRRPLWKGAVLLLAAWLACVPVHVISRHMTVQRDAFLAKVGQPETKISGHPIWHSVYIGLAFFPNPEVKAYEDSVGMAKVASIDPAVAYNTPRYEQILKEEILRIARRQPMILIANLFCKTALLALLATVILFPARRYLLKPANLSWTDLAFGLAIAVSALNGILVTPRPRYLLSFLCITTLYSGIRYCERLSANQTAPAGILNRTKTTVF